MTNTAASPRPPSRWELWFGLFGGVTAWLLHLAIGFVIVFDGCAAGWNNLRLLVGGATVVAALVAAGATWIAYTTWRDLGDERDATAELDRGRRRFMAITRVWLSGLSLLIILALSVPIAWLNPCVPV